MIMDQKTLRRAAIAIRHLDDVLPMCDALRATLKPQPKMSENTQAEAEDPRPFGIPVAVLQAVRSERRYQNTKWVDHTHTVGEWILILRKLIADAERVVVKQGDTAAMHEIRQIAATALVAMEQCGSPFRALKHPDALTPNTPHPHRHGSEHPVQELHRAEEEIKQAGVVAGIAGEAIQPGRFVMFGIPSPATEDTPGIDGMIFRLHIQEQRAYERLKAFQKIAESGGAPADPRCNGHDYQRNVQSAQHEYLEIVGKLTAAVLAKKTGAC